MTSVVEGLCQGLSLEAAPGSLNLFFFSEYVFFCFAAFEFNHVSTSLYCIRSASSDAENPGNSLYVTGLSHRVTERDLEDHFSEEGKVF